MPQRQGMQLLQFRVGNAYSPSSSSLSSFLLFCFVLLFTEVDFGFFVRVGDTEVGGSDRFLPLEEVGTDNTSG